MFSRNAVKFVLRNRSTIEHEILTTESYAKNYLLM